MDLTVVMNDKEIEHDAEEKGEPVFVPPVKPQPTSGFSLAASIQSIVQKTNEEEVNFENNQSPIERMTPAFQDKKEANEFKDESKAVIGIIFNKNQV